MRVDSSDSSQRLQALEERVTDLESGLGELNNGMRDLESRPFVHTCNQVFIVNRRADATMIMNGYVKAQDERIQTLSRQIESLNKQFNFKLKAVVGTIALAVTFVWFAYLVKTSKGS